MKHISRRAFLEAGSASVAACLLPEAFASISSEPALSNGWPQPPQGRIEKNLNPEWQFFRPGYSKSPALQNSASFPESILQAAVWENVSLPHTVRLEPLNASGGRNYQGVCWYRKRLILDPAWTGQRIHLVFQGAMQVADIWLDGTHLFTHEGGYLPFTVDLTQHLSPKEKPEYVLTVRLNNADNSEVPPGKPQSQLDFVYFGGLYRSVSLRVVHPVHISDTFLVNRVAGGGLFVTTPLVTADSATVIVQTDVQNSDTRMNHVRVLQELSDADGNLVATSTTENHTRPDAFTRVTQTLHVSQPRLWHPEEPNLYVLHTTVFSNGTATDDQFTRVGLRAIHFDSENGLTINDRKFFSVGANRHQDHPYVGYALPDSAQIRDARKLRSAGFTSVRSHYPQAPAFMDACDELGILAIVSNPGWQYVGDELFKQRVYQNAREMVRRDRNHPSVLLWEAQLNESDNSSMAADLYRIVHEEFPTPGCYAAGDRIRKPIPDFHGWDVEYSYNDGSKPLWIREWGDHVDNWTDQQGSARAPRGWGESAMLVQAARHLQVLDEIFSRANGPLATGTSRPAGADLWAGVDTYRGYHHQPFYGGPLDLFRLPKFDYYMFQSQRSPTGNIHGAQSGPMVFVANFATLQSSTTVMVFSNCEEVRLSQNGKVVATQKPDDGYHLPHPPFTFRLSEFSGSQSMLFATGIANPGTPIGIVQAEGLIGGKVVTTHILEAPGVPTQIRLELDDCGIPLRADGADWIRVYAHICDARGNTYPHGDDDVTFTVTGEGRVIGDSSIGANPMHAEAGIATALIRSAETPGRIVVEASAFGLKPASLELTSQTADIRGPQRNTQTRILR